MDPIKSRKIIFGFVIAAVVLVSVKLVYTRQSDDEKSTYRVVAVKKGSEALTSVSNSVEVTLPEYLYIPTAFTPDGDGLNDTFAAKGQGISEFSIQIFNRWGNIIFESGDMEKPWDGTYKGEPVQEGTYVYIIFAKGYNGKVFQKSGSVTIVNKAQT
jgi:gliding motility-associated-like protein